MGFLGDLAGGAMRSLQNRAEEVQRYKAEFERYPTDKLINMFKNYSSGARKQAIYLILKERGVIRGN